MPKGKSEFPPEKKVDSNLGNTIKVSESLPVSDLSSEPQELSSNQQDEESGSKNRDNSEAEPALESQNESKDIDPRETLPLWVRDYRRSFDERKDLDTQKFLNDPNNTKTDRDEYLRLRKEEEQKFFELAKPDKSGNLNHDEQVLYLQRASRNLGEEPWERRTKPKVGAVPAVGRSSTRINASTVETDSLSNTDSTRKEGYAKLRSVIMERLGGVAEGVSERVKKLSERLSLRDLDLSGKLRKLGVNIFEGVKATGTGIKEDVKTAGRGIKRAITNPLESLRTARSGAEQAGKYAAYFASRDASWEEKGKKLKLDLVSFTENYNKLPFRQKAYMTAALIGGSAVASAAALPTISSVLAGAMYSMRGLGGAGFMLNRRKATERPEHFLSNKSDSVKNVYAAVTGALYMGTTTVAGHWATDKLAHWLGSMFGHEAVHPVAVAKPLVEAKLPITRVELHTEPSIKLPDMSHITPPPLVMHETITAAGSSPEISIEAQGGHGYEYMTKRLWEQLQQKHLDPNQYPADSDIHKLLLADASSIDKVVHQIAADPKHAFFTADGTSVQVSADAQMSIGSDGEIRISTGGHDVIKAPTGAPTTPTYPPEATPSSPEVPHASPETPVADTATPTETATPIEAPPQETISRITIDTPSHITVNPNELPVEQMHTVTVESPAPVTLGIENVKQPTTVLNGPDGNNAIQLAHEAVSPPITAHTTSVQEQAPSSFAIEHTKEFINQSYNLPINPLEGHIYQDTNASVYAYGNDYAARVEAAKAYVTAHRDAIVWVQGENMIPYEGQNKPFVFPVEYGGLFSGVRVTLPGEVIDPRQLGVIDPETFIKQLDK